MGKNYIAACEYYRENHNLDVPAAYVTKNGIRLGSWIARMKSIKKGTAKKGVLTDDKIRRLEEIGMVWEESADLSWKRSYLELCKYKEMYGDFAIPSDYITPNGVKLYAWTCNQKARYKNNKLSAERIELLKNIDFPLETEDVWKKILIF